MPSEDALAHLQLGSDRLVLRPSPARPFGDLELHALVSLLEEDDGALLKGIRHLDVSSCLLGPAGVMLLAHLLRHRNCSVEYLDLSNQVVDRESVCSFASAVREVPSLRELRMDGCHLGDEGGRIILDIINDIARRSRSLRVIDIQNNYISFDVCSQLSKVAGKVGVKLNLQGNRVLDEVFNSVSHGIGEMLAIAGSIMLGRRQGCDRPAFQVWSVVMYCVALNVLYLSSTLYHSFFALGRATVYVFSILDFSGIFVLIAGSYSPFLGVALYEFYWAAVLQGLMWTVALTGICTAAFYTGPYAIVLRLSLYITMGWMAMLIIRPLSRKLGTHGTMLLVMGGVFYTAGVPFFVRDRHTLGLLPDHTIWHIFVVGGSITHYYCIYKYVVTGGVKKELPRVNSEEDMSVPLTPL